MVKELLDCIPRCFYWLCIIFTGPLVLAPSGFAQADITLRLLDAGSGKPITGISLSVFAWDENEGRQKQPPPGILKIDKNTQVVKTDKQGRAIFRLYDEHGLKTLNISTFDLRGCSEHQFSIEEVQKSGMVASYHGGKPQWCVPLRAQADARPGEIIIFDKRLTVWDRMRQEIP
jgi:hypothetical protein